MLKSFLATLVCIQMCLSASNITLKNNNLRKAFIRDEEVVLEYSAAGLEDGGDYSVTLDIDGVINETKQLQDEGAVFRFDACDLKPGKYNAQASLISGDKKLSNVDTDIMISNMWNPERIRVWLWAHYKFGEVVYKDSPEAREMLAWYVDKGFNSFVPGGGVGAKTNYGGFDEGKLALFDYGLYNGLEMGVSAYRSCFMDIEDESLKFKINKKWLQDSNLIPNPFEKEVTLLQDTKNIEMMEILQQFPGVKLCYLESEFEDYLPAAVPLADRYYKYPQPKKTPHKFLMKGVIADTDEKYVDHIYRFQWGDSIVYMNENVAKVVKQYRPDIKVFSDPLRRTLVRERMQGLDGISTWTYTNPDPKYTLYVELLNNYAEAEGKDVFHTITFYNSRGSIAPADCGDVVLGPDRLVENSWINLSRNTGSLCYYIGSANDPFAEELTLYTGGKSRKSNARYPYNKYPPTFEALGRYHERIVQPFGPMINKLKGTSRKTAVLASESAFVYRDGPAVASWYQNYYVMDFYALLAMNQIPADIITDEDVRRGKLSDYDNLFLIRCDTLTKSVYDAVIDYQQGGGKLYSDKYLRAEFDNVKRFDFEFGYRRRVNVNALTENKLFAGGGDTLDDLTSKIESTEGITADQDQKIMESYASRLDSALGTDVERVIKCSSLNVVSNMLQNGDTSYLFLINDKRTYSDRFADCEKCKGMLDKFVEQDVEIELLEKDAKYGYDMIAGKMFEINNGKFDVTLDDLGGRIIALSNQKLDAVEIDVPRKCTTGEKVNIAVSIFDDNKNYFDGAVPIHFSLTSPDGSESIVDYYAATDGFRSIEFIPALNDIKGMWKIEVTELFTGKKTSEKFELD
ncbi:MAG: hypothetical protein ACIAQZ_11665 [Sedimentisphaeraceae bacterium JB056]